MGVRVNRDRSTSGTSQLDLRRDRTSRPDNAPWTVLGHIDGLLTNQHMRIRKNLPFPLQSRMCTPGCHIPENPLQRPTFMQLGTSGGFEQTSCRVVTQASGKGCVTKYARSDEWVWCGIYVQNVGGNQCDGSGGIDFRACLSKSKQQSLVRGRTNFSGELIDGSLGPANDRPSDNKDQSCPMGNETHACWY